MSHIESVLTLYIFLIGQASGSYKNLNDEKKADILKD